MRTTGIGSGSSDVFLPTCGPTRTGGVISMTSRPPSSGWSTRSSMAKISAACSTGSTSGAPRSTPTGLLIVGDDVTARIKLAALRLVLGKGIAGESRIKLDDQFARQLLEGASLEALSTAHGMEHAHILAKLALLVTEQSQPGPAPRPAPMIGDEAESTDDVPDWVQHYEDLPCPVGVLAYPSLRVRWVNRQVLENNQVSADALVDRPVDEIWDGARDWTPHDDQSMAEGRTLESVNIGRNLRGAQHWGVVRRTPVSHDRILVIGEDVTAQLRLQALRLLLHLHPGDPDDATEIDDTFARLLLEGASLANLCAGLELSRDQVLRKLGPLLGSLG